jgi:hypothetical protein
MVCSRHISRKIPREATSAKRGDGLLDAAASGTTDAVSGQPRAGGVHLVGSVPLAGAESVFRAVSDAVGPYLRRLPDGETGERRRWIFFQSVMLARHPAMEPDPTVGPFLLRQWDGTLLREIELLRFRETADPEHVAFETGYASAAASSYDVFRRLRADAVIPTGTRLQVCLPTPMASAYMYVSPHARAAYMPAYERALTRDVRNIVATIPAADLAIQWDVCQEVLVAEGYFPDRPADHREQIARELARLGDLVPASVEMGYHLCYGSPADEHLVMPSDMALMVGIANDVRAALARRIDFLHMPVPRDRTDDAYFAPLAGLAGAGTFELYLGLVHHADPEGDRARIAAARRVVDGFGVSSECGWGRTDPTRVAGILESHRRAAEIVRRAPPG